LELCSVVLLVQVKPKGTTGNIETGGTALSRAQTLLRLLVHDLEATLQANLRQHELEAVRRQLERWRMTQTGFSEQPTIRRLSIPNKDPRVAAPGRHAREVVQTMLDYVRDRYQRPMALKEVAAYLGMNANYLSGLFHRSTGMTFHRYLHAVRMHKAEELLRDPRTRICDVATAVGYASPNHFRSAFKACERLSPTAWTEMQQAVGRLS
jgi:AraC-like DNA-binding protein